MINENLTLREAYPYKIKFYDVVFSYLHENHRDMYYKINIYSISGRVVDIELFKTFDSDKQDEIREKILNTMTVKELKKLIALELLKD